MLAAVLLLSFSIRAELVEARHQSAPPAARPSTSSGQTEEVRTAVEAELAFAADAKELGQWTAFRTWAADDAIMFFPEPGNVQERLKDAKDPPRSVDWWPTASYVSCNGKLTVNTGGWRRPDGSVGFFSTVWEQQPDGSWRWIVNGGGSLTTARPRPSSPTIVHAVCPKGVQPPFHLFHTPPPEVQVAEGQSADGSLAWGWQRDNGVRSFVTILRGRGQVIADRVDE